MVMTSTLAVGRRGDGARLWLAALIGLVAPACSGAPQLGGDLNAGDVRAHDSRLFVLDGGSLPFEALDALPSARAWGMLGNAGYRIEVPVNWNGALVMYAHGHRQIPDTLTVSNPGLRAHLLALGYAWAASSYSANLYDVRAGIEDTNALARSFTRLAAAHGRTLAEPERIYITGRSMGGHIAAAAVEAETLAAAHHRVRYRGALAMCGVTADLELMNYYAAYALALFELGGHPAGSYPIEHYEGLLPQVQAALWESFPERPARNGITAQEILMHLSGGARPGYAPGFAAWQPRLLQLGAGRDDLSAPDLRGVLARGAIDTRQIEYRFDSPPDPAIDSATFNARVLRVQPDPQANPARRDGLRWVPPVAGEFDVPVLTLHGLGDLYVPLRMAQIHARRAAAHGRSHLLVQRAIRSVEHCDFSAKEEAAAFDALIAWDQHGERPAGDDLLDVAAVSAPGFGCAFTEDDSPPSATRASIAPCP